MKNNRNGIQDARVETGVVMIWSRRFLVFLISSMIGVLIRRLIAYRHFLSYLRYAENPCKWNLTRALVCLSWVDNLSASCAPSSQWRFPMFDCAATLESWPRFRSRQRLVCVMTVSPYHYFLPAEPCQGCWDAPGSTPCVSFSRRLR